MEPNKVQGKRSLTAKARDEADEEGEEEEEEEEIDDDVVSGGGLGFQSGGDEYMVRKKRLVIAGEGRARGSGSGSGAGGSTARPGCQADSCPADLSEAKHYHRRHKICEIHAKAPVVLVAGLQQRFCQQCSRFSLQKKTLIFFNFFLL